MEETEAVHVRRNLTRVRILNRAIFHTPPMICLRPKGLGLIRVILPSDFSAKMRLRFVIWPDELNFCECDSGLSCAPLLLFVSLVTYFDLPATTTYHDYHSYLAMSTIQT